MRFRLRTLLIVLALAPPAIWLVWLAASYVLERIEDGRGEPLGQLFALAVVSAAAAYYLFVPPPGKGHPTLRTLLVALAILVLGLGALGLVENLIGGFDYAP
jgi:hypothetical protein